MLLKKLDTQRARWISMRSEGLDIQRAVGHTTKLLGFHAVGRRGRSRGLFNAPKSGPSIWMDCHHALNGRVLTTVNF